MTRRFYGRPVLAIIIVMGGFSAGCGPKVEKQASADTTPKVIQVKAEPIVLRDVERTVDVVGTLKGWEEVTIGTKRTGRVAAVKHDMGDRVKPGEVLVELETIDTELNVQQADKRLLVELAKLGLRETPSANFEFATVPTIVEAKVKLERTRQNLNRERNLIAKGAGTSQDFQNAENDLKGAEAGLEIAMMNVQSTMANVLSNKVALDVARQARRDMEIVVPVLSSAPPGHEGSVEFAISKRSVSEGQMVREGEAVISLVVEDPLRLWTNVPEKFSGQVELGQDVRIEVGSHPDEIFKGKVVRINPSVDPVSRTFQVETVIANSKGYLRPGGFAKASIMTAKHDQANTVPRASVVRFAGVTKIFVVDGKRAKSINVDLGLEGDGWVEVSGQIPANALVVTGGITQLADGTLIEIRSDETESSASSGESTADKGDAPQPEKAGEKSEK